MLARPPIRGDWFDDGEVRAVYAEAAGIHQLVPAGVALPADADDIVALVRWAKSAGVTLTPRGSGSSMAGGAVTNGIVVDVSRIDEIGAIDTKTRRVIVGPGAVCADVNAAAAAAGLRLPVDPSSAPFCTIGGMVATNAAGGRTLRYGQMNAWVHGLECVFSDGTRVWIRRGEPEPRAPALDRFAMIAGALRDEERRAPSMRAGLRKNSSGYALGAWAASRSLVDLLAGSEGTLAFFPAVELQLAPVPGATGTVLATFATIDNAVAAAATAAELNAAACELLDRTFLDIAERGGPLGLPEGTDAVLIVELEEPDATRLSQMTAAFQGAFRDTGAVSVEAARDEMHGKSLWKLRHAASPILAAMSESLISMQLIEDGAVPPARLGEYVRGVRDILARHGFTGVLFGHAGDGHLHANVLVDVEAPHWKERLGDVFDATVSLTIGLGGTLSGEHGDGRLRAQANARVWPAGAGERFRRVKETFDPEGLLNPGVKLTDDASTPLGAPVKYDPALQPLPAAARRALDRVQRERAWRRPRIELLEEERGR